VNNFFYKEFQVIGEEEKIVAVNYQKKISLNP
jgi:hypothetical protein